MSSAKALTLLQNLGTSSMRLGAFSSSFLSISKLACVAKNATAGWHLLDLLILVASPALESQLNALLACKCSLSPANVSDTFTRKLATFSQAPS